MVMLLGGTPMLTGGGILMPPPTGGGGGGSSANLSTLLPTASHRTKRSNIVSTHFPGTGAEGEFTGFTSAELSSFTTVTVTTFDDLNNQINSMAVGDKKIFECNWDGISSSSVRPHGPSATSLTANASVDWGYDRPGWSVLIRPATGRSPILQATYSNTWYWSGCSKIELQDLTFDTGYVRFDANSTYPAIAMVAVTGSCKFQNMTNVTGSLNPQGARVLHVDGASFDTCMSGVQGAAEYVRVWNTTYRKMVAGDIHGWRGYNKSYTTNWTANIWVAGCTVYDQSQTDPSNANHCDFFQTSLATGENHNGYTCLVECNMAHLNRPTASTAATQGVFGDDDTGWDGDWLIHNNIILLGAYWGLVAYDPNDNMAKVATKNMFLRQGNVPNADSDQRVTGLRRATGTGSLEVSNNYSTTFTTGQANGESFTGNVIADSRASATSPVQYGTLFSGTFTYGASGVSYTSPDAGAASASAAKTAIANQFQPVAGWAVTAGPEDPATWPSGDWSALT